MLLLLLLLLLLVICWFRFEPAHMHLAGSQHQPHTTPRRRRLLQTGAKQALPDGKSVVYYDPLSSNLSLFQGIDAQMLTVCGVTLLLVAPLLHHTTSR
jgi:hypothetical protein